MKRNIGIFVLLALLGGITNYVKSNYFSQMIVTDAQPAVTVQKGHKSPAKAHLRKMNIDRCVAYEKAGDSQKHLTSWRDGSNQPDPVRGDALKVTNRFFRIGNFVTPNPAHSTTMKPTPKTSSKSSSKLPAADTTDKIDTDFAILLIPDPMHTNLSLLADRSIAAVQQAAQDVGYQYDSQWLPWHRNTGDGLNILSDRLWAEDIEEARERCPGVMFFRHADQEKNLVVFIVGEQPTAGINVDQWEYAVDLIKANSAPVSPIPPAPAASSPRKIQAVSGSLQHGESKYPPLRIIGPMFSGSLPALQERVDQAKHDFDKILILSGTLSNGNNIEDFQQYLGALQPALDLTTKNLTPQPSTHHYSFGTFNESDCVHILRFLDFLTQQGRGYAKVAMLSEDETAYGIATRSPYPMLNAPGAVEPNDNLGPCEFHRLHQAQGAKAADATETKSVPHVINLSYPRDISVMRSAYEKQSVFDSVSPKEHSIRPILRNFDDSAASDGLDSVPSYSGATLNAVDQEARLFGLLDALRVDHVSYLILRSTNPLDLLFLTRFFHRAYPETHIVTVGADLLFRREIDTTAFRGTMSLSSFSLVPREQDWKLIESQHMHAVFTGSMSVGQYLAARTMFDRVIFDQWKNSPPLPCKDAQSYCVEQLSFDEGATQGWPNYGPPIWLDRARKYKPGKPVTWLTTVGRDGYWPVAALDQNVAGSTGLVSLRGQYRQDNRAEWTTPTHSWWICMVLALSLCAFQLIGLHSWRGFTSDDLSVAFRNSGTSKLQPHLRGINAASAVTPLLVLLVPYFFVVSYTWVWIGLLAVIIGLFFAWGFLSGSEEQGKLTGYNFSLAARFQFKVRAFFIFLGYAASILGAVFLVLNHASGDQAFYFPLWYRMEHLDDGLSPIVPILLLCLAVYFFTWQAMAGNLLLDEGRPLLPLLWKTEEFVGVWEEREADGGEKNEDYRGLIRFTLHGMRWLRRFFSPLTSLAKWVGIYWAQRIGTPQEEPRGQSWKYLRGSQHSRLTDHLENQIRMAARTSFLAHPLPLIRSLVYFLLVLWFARDGITYSSLEGFWYSWAVMGAAILLASFTLLEAYHLYATWVQLRRLLLALGRTRLRQALMRFRPVAATTLWTASGNVHRVQYRLFFQQWEALRRLQEVHGQDGVTFPEKKDTPLDPEEGVACIRVAVTLGRKIIADTRYSLTGSNNIWGAPLLEAGAENRNIRRVFADTAGFLLNDLWETEWKKDPIPLYTRDSLLEKTAERFTHLSDEVLPTHVKKARAIKEAKEEFLAAFYTSFVHNILARMRTMTMSIVLIFVPLCFALSLYPFTPRTYISSLLLLNFFLVAILVGYVYAQMDRNDWLDRVTNPDRGKLGAEFWVKMAGFLAGPILGLLATQYPGIVEWLFGWLGPGMNLAK